jgi:hypothetical protein
MLRHGQHIRPHRHQRLPGGHPLTEVDGGQERPADRAEASRLHAFAAPGGWDPTPQQYVAAKAEAARHLRARKPLALIGLVLAGIALTTGATLAIVTALQPGPHPSAFGPAKALTPKIPAPQRGGSRSSTTGHRHQAGRPPVVLPVLSQPVSGTHTTVARTTSPRSSSKPGAVTGTGTPGPTASPSPSPSRSTQQCAIRLLGLCL